MTAFPRSLVVVDASLAVPWVVVERFSAEARGALQDWDDRGVTRLVPSLFASELNAALLKQIRQGAMTLDDARRAFRDLLAAVTVMPDDAALAPRALEIADGLSLWKAYDSLYLALAEREGCELWTGDERFYNLVRGAYPWVHWVGE